MKFGVEHLIIISNYKYKAIYKYSYFKKEK